MIRHGAIEEATFEAGPVCLDEMVTVMGQYDPRNRWNGWLCPRMDAHAVETVMGAFAKAAEEDPAIENTYSHSWGQGGCLIVVETFDGEEYTDTVVPDEDGLYDLGSHAWTWSADDDPESAWVNGLPKEKTT